MNKKKPGDFDRFALNYREIHDKNIKISGADSDYFSEYKAIKIKKRENNRKFEKILDLGCGDGNSTIFLRKYFSQTQIIGIDVSGKSIEMAKDKNISNSTFSLFDGEKIPFNNNCFDLVFAACVFHHIDINKHEILIGEIFRVLKPGGVFYIFEHNPFNPITRKLVKNCEFDDKVILINPGSLKRMIMKNKFVNIEIRYAIFFPRIKILKFLIAMEQYLSWLPLGGQYFLRVLKK